MLACDFLNKIEELGIDFFAGVPDSLLQPFLNEIGNRYTYFDKHMVAANEGAAVGLAAGYYMSTGKPACVYLQNSGIGNIFNPVCSLTNEKVYGIPVLYVVGWRGEPGVKDEPQHIFQGEITVETLDLLDIAYEIIDMNMTEDAFNIILDKCMKSLKNRKSIALVIKKGALQSGDKTNHYNSFQLKREQAINIITSCLEDALYISSTGKISRELYEIRDKNCQTHDKDFLTVGSMGHCSSIALTVALSSKNSRIVCLDGDGAMIMHLGALTTIGRARPANYIHILLDNEAHETVGGIPTVSGSCDLCMIARACGYVFVYEAAQEDELRHILLKVKETKELTFIRIKVALGARENLGRPKTTPKENLGKFMSKLI